MVKKILLHLLALLLFMRAGASGSAQFDSLYQELQAADVNDTTFNMWALADQIWKSDSTAKQQALNLYRLKEQQSLQSHNLLQQTFYKYISCYLLLNQGRVNEAKAEWLRCAQMFKQLGRTKDEAQCYTDLATQVTSGDDREKLDYLYQAIYLSEECKDSAGLSFLYSSLARFCRRNGNLKKSISYALKMVGKECMDTVLSFSLAGHYYLKLGDTLRGEQLLQKAARIFPCGTTDTVNFFFNRAMGYYYHTKGRLDVSDYYLKRLIRSLLINGTYQTDPEPLLILADNYRLRGNIAQQKLWIDTACYFIADSSIPYFIQQVYEARYKFEEQQGNDKDALTYYKKYRFWTDSIARMGLLDEMTATENEAEYKQRREEYEEKSKQQLVKQRNIIYSAVAFLLVAFLFAAFQYRNYRQQKRANNNLAAEKKRSEDLLLNILPAEVAEELKAKGSADARLFNDVTVLFTDFKSFTRVSERLTPQQLVDELNVCFSAFDAIITRHNIEKIKTVGDAYLAVSGLPVASAHHAADAIAAAVEIRDFMKQRMAEKGENTFDIRIGVHSGSVVAGIVGVKKFAYDIWGDTVNTAARMEQNSEAGKINISQTTYELVKDKFTCRYRGEIEAKNKGKLKMYFVS